MISLKEYATIHGKNLRVLQLKAKEGRISAFKIGRDWYIDENAEVIDERVTSGKYYGWRKKYGGDKGVRKNADTAE